MADAPVVEARCPVGALPQLLAALQDPVRLEMVRRLHEAGEAVKCAALYDGINKSTATHHFNILRDAGLTERVVSEGHIYQRLRADDVDAAMPGLLDAILEQANRESGRR
ncbi:ArsR/SmtB family transcription factor [Mycolicibacterium porcinum]|uniref:Helix-turn-helix transcriptional regulator n=1 Tax=Mycolicibacterium porcinum TaxID=39693 RepID=A0AAW5TDE5_9MYCO|nr:helix-turn-helix transcriptional regulator [Mycolicibacterium porcinum]MBX8687641.1 helix-turn-helix domain-containing protein [Mycobacterium sp. 20091114027_K0903767]OCB48985.1 ArsR family transcriptional regulator [Mycolicibacterium vulneris]MCV7392361.1 helix-turn-helix transcriptional regulator [Mycolicibacterium porcinum]ODR27300.1 ArsR family transcriptional regulator [Mycolicibacterium porcinum]ORB41201.1 transcriptional regulator [Mycolicibacterium porcinum]